MMPVLVLDAQSSAIASHDHLGAEDGVEVIDVYELPSLDLDRFAAMLVTDMVDQEFLWQQREVVASFLAHGRVVVFCGQLLRDWLPGCGTFVPARITSMRDYAVQLVEAHPVFAGVDPRDLTFRRGVAGFFARGHNPPPHGAQVLATLTGGQPTTWIDRTTTPGTVFAHAGNSLMYYAQVDSTATRVAPQLLAWIRDEGSA
jgi:hypothetical protein